MAGFKQQWMTANMWLDLLQDIPELLTVYQTSLHLARSQCLAGPGRSLEAGGFSGETLQGVLDFECGACVGCI